jgi:hypothetical protein
MKKIEKKHLSKVAELGCIACTKLGYYNTPAEIHHVKRFGEKRNHFNVIPLCPYHHRTSKESVHLNPKWFIETFGSQENLLQEVNENINGKQN